MKYIGLNELRETFLKFFESKGHLRLESFPLVPQGDKSLLLINSGMAPLKPYFSGELTPPSKRACSCQKCVRTPDIERVGKTSRHGTYFEMLGNFSFGDYFKREAAAWSWEFCTKVLEMPPERLYVSVYLEDDEAMDIWTREVGVDPSHMVRLGKADNFWEIGSGPCGPCSEIYFDRGEQYSCGSPDCAVGCDCDRYVEFWNNVFTQFHNDGNGNYTPLAQKNIDTGMGLERLACIMQGVDNLFEVDTIRAICDGVCRLSGRSYKANAADDVSLRCVTDHIRSSTMLICDGVLPSNEGRGYVLRRLIRRAARHGRLLGLTEPFLHGLADIVIEKNAEAYPQLIEKRDYIKRVLLAEEERFALTIDSGLKLLATHIAGLKDSGESGLSGEKAFKLYDTYGFPVDLTLDILEESGFGLDMEGFHALMAEQRERARAARGNQDSEGWLNAGSEACSIFCGYPDSPEYRAVVEGTVLSVTERGDGRSAVILDISPFYAESGGQSSDSGVLHNESARLEVGAVHKTASGAIVHVGELSGELKAGDKIQAAIDAGARAATMRAHSAVHLLQSALREVLGTHVTQAGSLVTPDALRFDFTHYSAVTSEELTRVELLVNGYILSGFSVAVREMAAEEAKREGALALFSEKYGDTVRVVSMGDVSSELCGGTHVDNTAKIGSLRLTSEGSAAAGVRRIEAVVGLKALEQARSNTETLSELSALVKAVPGELAQRIKGLQEENRRLRRDAESRAEKDLELTADKLISAASEHGGYRLVVSEQAAATDLRRLGDILRGRGEDIIAVIAKSDEKSQSFMAVCGKVAVGAGIKAGEIIRELCVLCGGSGGGRPDSAMGGGRFAITTAEAITRALEIIRLKIK